MIARTYSVSEPFLSDILINCSIIGDHLSFLSIILKKNKFNINPLSTDVIEISLGGKPIENRSTLTPQNLAAKNVQAHGQR